MYPIDKRMCGSAAGCTGNSAKRTLCYIRTSARPKQNLKQQPRRSLRMKPLLCARGALHIFKPVDCPRNTCSGLKTKVGIIVHFGRCSETPCCGRTDASSRARHTRSLLSLGIGTPACLYSICCQERRKHCHNTCCLHHMQSSDLVCSRNKCRQAPHKCHHNKMSLLHIRSPDSGC